ncbi:MAG: 16S rRNA (uracil(1498)-N(3))-methyltransferase [Limisphaerales bacterium]
MNRFFLRTGAGPGGTLVLDEGDSRHAARVLRLAAGDPVEILDGAGRILRGRVADVGRRETRVEILAVRAVPSPPRVGLAPSLIKGKAMDFLVQKATELGVVRLEPLATERAVVRLKGDEGRARVADWTRTAVEACKQCGNPWLPEILAPVETAAFLERRSGDGILLVASLRSDALPVRRALAGAVAPAVGVTLVLGPEGDFTPDEEEMLRAAGARPITLGPLVLRAETAAIAGLAVIQNELASGGAG